MLDDIPPKIISKNRPRVLDYALQDRKPSYSFVESHFRLIFETQNT